MAKNGKNKPLGERLIELGSLRADQIPTLLELQQRDTRIAHRLEGFCSEIGPVVDEAEAATREMQLV